jgi:tetratricopeptide (TPR) repeat protein
MAKHYYQQAIKIDSSNWRAYKGIAAVIFEERYYSLDHAEKRELAQIERDYLEQGYLHNPLDAVLVFDYGMATVFLGDTDAGIELLEKGAALRPFNDIYWWRLGITQRKAGRYEEALETFRYAQSLKNSPVTRKNIQWLERQLNPPPKSEVIEVTPEPITREPPEEKMPLDELHKLMETF